MPEQEKMIISFHALRIKSNGDDCYDDEYLAIYEESSTAKDVKVKKNQVSLLFPYKFYLCIEQQKASRENPRNVLLKKVCGDSEVQPPITVNSNLAFLEFKR